MQGISPAFCSSLEIPMPLTIFEMRTCIRTMGFKQGALELSRHAIPFRVAYYAAFGREPSRI